MNILFTCIGRRVSLLRSFREAAAGLKLKAMFLGTDTTELSPALSLCDRGFVVKPTSDPKYIKQLLSIVKENKVGLLVPTVDLDLGLLADNKQAFEKIGCKVLISDLKVVDICRDKRRTCRFLVENGFDTPWTVSPRLALSKRKMDWPCFIKPWDGYASRGTAKVNNRNELLFYSKRIPNPICQEFIDGKEFTCDVYVDFEMNVRCVVPRKRIEIRSGEVSKGQVIKNKRIMDECSRLVKKLGAGPGVITIQLIVSKEGELKIIEVNPRFGGGAPLSIKAGADFPKWILQELTGGKPRIVFDGFKDKLVMLRYDAEVWIEDGAVKGKIKNVK